ncbi:U2 small nuclear RNA auxiliary factor 1-like 4, isoform CRA_a [Rattus norvegicus]|uniref:U2 small nuclear RNA auxiliary factor 1-like 4, isoform CRA_a n=1 Tax=Rattus norvegicus TaxID=10116 RepID=A6J9Z5_RAT|nr:U2 small nuclear RNA auxiliary factor 1-like 4, isoform CRA_a [Rattus norvegicus]
MWRCKNTMITSLRSRNLRRQLYGRGPRHRSPPRSHTGHRPRERNRRRSPDHRHGRF